MPAVPPPLYRAEVDAQDRGDDRARLPLGNPLGRLESAMACVRGAAQLLAELLPFGSQLASLWLSHAPVTPHGRRAITPTTLRFHLSDRL